MNTQQIRTYLESNENYDSKIKVIKTRCTKEQLQKWSVKVAYSVLPIYEKEYPNDTIVRECIEACELYLEGSIDELLSKKKATYNAAYNAAYNDAYNAAYAAYNAANAAYNAAYNVAYNAAYNAAYAANAAKKKQQELNIQLMVEVLEVRLANTKITRKLYKNQIRKQDKEYIYI